MRKDASLLATRLQIYLLLLHKLHFEGNRDMITDDKSAGFEHDVPAKAKFLAIDFGLSRKSDARSAPWVFDFRSRSFCFEYDFLRHSVHRKLSCYEDLIVRFLPPFR